MVYLSTQLRRVSSKSKGRREGNLLRVNLIHSPSNANLERDCVDILLKHGVRIVEASAFMSASENLLVQIEAQKRTRLYGNSPEPKSQEQHCLHPLKR